MILKYSKTGETENIGLGQIGSGVLDDGESVTNLGTKVVVAITMLEDTTFTTLTEENKEYTGTGTSDHGNSIVNTDTFGKGITIFGRWTAVTCNTGLCICYLG